MAKVTLESLLADAGKVIVPRELLERAMHALQSTDSTDKRLIGHELENLLNETDEDRN